MREVHVTAEDVADSKMRGEVAARFSRLDDERKAWLENELRTYGHCRQCGSRVMDRPVLTGQCASCAKRPSRSMERAVAARARRNAHDNERKQNSPLESGGPILSAPRGRCIPRR